ncbi:MAG: hypothetical protein HOC20_03185 [Chloroflexi bacterium]|jgi:hypothetical protein|nr:hypothetical protein [Chloroflexota bacterium]
MDKDKYQTTKYFKKCPMCGMIWDIRAQLLSDPDAKVTGYIANLDHAELGIFLFNHETCGTSMGIEASQFTDMYDGPIYTEKLTRSAECPGYCLDKAELRRCPSKCECSYIRDVLDQIVNWEKSMPQSDQILPSAYRELRARHSLNRKDVSV